MLESILSDLDKHLGICAIKGKNEQEGFFFLKIPPQTEILVKDLKPGFYLQSAIGANIEATSREDFYIYLMKANFLWQGTGGSIIGLDPSEKYLTLSLPIVYEVNFRMFRDKLEEFLNYLEFWQKEIEKFRMN
jgi:hypothetical protein